MRISKSTISLISNQKKQKMRKRREEMTGKAKVRQTDLVRMKTLKTEHEKYQLSNVHIHHLSSSCSVGRVGWSVDQSAKAQMAGRLVGHNTPHHTTHSTMQKKVKKETYLFYRKLFNFFYYDNYSRRQKGCLILYRKMR